MLYPGFNFPLSNKQACCPMRADICLYHPFFAISDDWSLTSVHWLVRRLSIISIKSRPTL